MRALVTGGLGFVGRYLREELESHGYEVTGLDLREGPQTLRADLLDRKMVFQAVDTLRPQVIFHLAGQADVGKSWREPQETVEANVVAALNLMDAVREIDPACRMVLVGSSDQYGQLGKAGENVTEDTPVDPQTPYAVSKLAQEKMAKIYARAYGMNISMTRSFNHGGPGQREGFLIPDFASGIVRVEKGLQNALRVGNLSSRRDFTHVRDVVRAYRLIAEKGRAGEVYNVGSGSTYSAQEILDKLLALSDKTVPVEVDPARMRPSDTPVIRCNHDKLTRDTGWEPELSLDQILTEVLAQWRQKYA